VTPSGHDAAAYLTAVNGTQTTRNATYTHIQTDRQTDREDKERQVSYSEVQQQNVGWTSTSRPASHNHHDNEQVPDDADECDKCEDNGSLEDTVLVCVTMGVVIVHNT